MPPAPEIAPSPAPEVSCENCHQPIGSESPLFCKNCGRQWHQYCFISAKLCPKCTTPLVSMQDHAEAIERLRGKVAIHTKHVLQGLLLMPVATIGLAAVFASKTEFGHSGKNTIFPGDWWTEGTLIGLALLATLWFAIYKRTRSALVGSAVATIAYANVFLSQLNGRASEMEQKNGLMVQLLFYVGFSLAGWVAYNLNVRRSLLAVLANKEKSACTIVPEAKNSTRSEAVQKKDPRSPRR